MAILTHKAAAAAEAFFNGSTPPHDPFGDWAGRLQMLFDKDPDYASDVVREAGNRIGLSGSDVREIIVAYTID